MRKVKFQKFVKQNIKTGAGQWVNASGLFHAWGLEGGEVGETIASWSVGIVEDETGVVHLVQPDKLSFMDPPPNEGIEANKPEIKIALEDVNLGDKETLPDELFNVGGLLNNPLSIVIDVRILRKEVYAFPGAWYEDKAGEVFTVIKEPASEPGEQINYVLYGDVIRQKQDPQHKLRGINFHDCEIVDIEL